VRLEIELEAARNAMQELEDEVPEGAVNCPSRDANHTSETDSRRERSM
jgi:hypothetical protein